jgi:hypothetical protein
MIRTREKGATRLRGGEPVFDWSSCFLLSVRQSARHYRLHDSLIGGRLRALLPGLISRAVMVALLGSTLASADRTPVSEYQLKAVFLFNFTKFVEWPMKAFSDPHDPFTICLAGANPFGSSLDDEVRGKTVGSRPILIRLVSNAQEARKCQILFVPASERKREHGLLDLLRDASVLTVGDSSDFTTNGGIVQLES